MTKLPWLTREQRGRFYCICKDYATTCYYSGILLHEYLLLTKVYSTPSLVGLGERISLIFVRGNVGLVEERLLAEALCNVCSHITEINDDHVPAKLDQTLYRSKPNTRS